MVTEAAGITGAVRPVDAARMPRRHVPEAGGRTRFEDERVDASSGQTCDLSVFRLAYG